MTIVYHVIKERITKMKRKIKKKAKIKKEKYKNNYGNHNEPADNWEKKFTNYGELLK